MIQFKFKAIGTSWIIDIYDAIDSKNEADVLSAIMNRIDEFDRVYSRFRSDSIVTQMSQKKGNYTLPHDSQLLFSIYSDLYRLTHGFFTQLVGQMLVDAGYDPAYSLKQKKALTAPPRWEEVMEFRIGSSKERLESPILSILKPVQLDFGAAGKGYLIDLVGKVLTEKKVHGFLINAGGDILHKSNEQPIRIGLENPNNFDQVIGICELKNKSICGSAGSRRVWGNFTHIMNPYTLLSPRDITAVWVVSDTVLISDALTTCLFFVQPETLSDKYMFEYVILYKDGSFKKSEYFPGLLFTS